MLEETAACLQEPLSRQEVVDGANRQEYGGYREQVARECMFKLEEAGVYASMPRGDEGMIWDMAE